MHNYNGTHTHTRTHTQLHTLWCLIKRGLNKKEGSMISEKSTKQGFSSDKFIKEIGYNTPF